MVALPMAVEAWAQDVPRRNIVPPSATTPSVPVAAPSPASFPGVALPVAALKNSTLELALNKAQMLELPQAASNIIIGNEEVADVHIDPDHPTKAFIIAKEVGSTNIYFLDSAGQAFRSIDVRVAFDSSGLQDALSALMPKENIKISMFRDNIFLSGTVRSADAVTNAGNIARRFVAEDVNVTNMLTISGSQQVILQVRVSEMVRGIRKQLSFNTTVTKGIGNFGVNFQTIDTLSTLTAFGTGNFATGTKVLGNPYFETLEQQNLIKTLAEPTLTALSGETASFLSGGEYPFPTGVDENGNAIIEFREFGIRLNFTPVVQDSGRISLHVAAEISAIDTATTVSVANSTINALTNKRTETTIDLPSGGTLMISGLLNNDFNNNIIGMPFLKDIPILGALFRSTEFQRDETEMVVTVSAYLAKPASSHSELALPSDGFEPASDIDIYLLGHLHKYFGDGDQSFWDNPIIGPFGYIMK